VKEVINSFIELGDKTIEQEEEIERLKEEYMILQNASDEVEEEKDKEIERLNSALKEYDRGTYCKLINENRKLNNIINELEQELVKKLEAVKTIKNTLGEGAYVVNPHIDLLEQEYNYFYKKLQELKGVDKE
jgi:cell fate (sporulation/competence/biofilm development) regulator YlbF (YheA/YmcA/DUF963 family)